MCGACAGHGESPAVDFDARAGEILGIGGLLGSGRSELLLAIFGSEPIVEGEIKIDGETVKPTGPRSMMNAGVALLTEDRKVLGLLPELSIRENVTIASLRSWFPERAAAGTSNRRPKPTSFWTVCDCAPASYDQPVSTLSGGNQQKVLLARWLLTKPKVIMFDEPTKGIDVGAKGELYDVINDLARQGLAVIVVSSYLPELLGLSDRVLVLRDEEIAGELPGGASEEDVLRLASGGVVEPKPSRIICTESRASSTIPSSTLSSARTSRRRSPMPRLRLARAHRNNRHHQRRGTTTPRQAAPTPRPGQRPPRGRAKRPRSRRRAATEGLGSRPWATSPAAKAAPSSSCWSPSAA